jgi:hypothetical protein
MGNWNITIRGVGCHHNLNYAEDANRLAAKFVAELRAAGHSIVAASFAYGAEDDIGNGDYIADRDALDSAEAARRGIT